MRDLLKLHVLVSCCLAFAALRVNGDCRPETNLAALVSDARQVVVGKGAFTAVIRCYKPALSSDAYERAPDSVKLVYLAEFIHTLKPLVAKPDLGDRAAYLSLGADLCDDYLEVFRTIYGAMFEASAPKNDIDTLRDVVVDLGLFRNAQGLQESLFAEYQSLFVVSRLSPFNLRSAKQWHRGLLCEASGDCTENEGHLISALKGNSEYRDHWLKFYDFVTQCASVPRIGAFVDPKQIDSLFGVISNGGGSPQNASSR